MASGPSRPWRSAPALLPAAVLGVLEAIGALAFGAVQVTAVQATRPEVAIGTVVTMLVYGGGLLLGVRGLLRHRGWGRALVVVAQLLNLPIAWQLADGETLVVGVLLGVVSVAVLVCVFWPSSVRVFADPNGPPGQH